MKKLNDILIEKKKEKEEEKIVFIETDPRSPFPIDTIGAIEKQINSNAKDLEKEWKDVIHLVNTSFDELKVPIPLAFLKERTVQYQQLIAYAIKQLADSRGFKSSWTLSV
jgi:hypothetical protein